MIKLPLEGGPQPRGQAGAGRAVLALAHQLAEHGVLVLGRLRALVVAAAAAGSAAAAVVPHLVDAERHTTRSPPPKHYTAPFLLFTTTTQASENIINIDENTTS